MPSFFVVFFKKTNLADFLSLILRLFLYAIDGTELNFNFNSERI
ncbi:hypothetical protein LEP1GSC014_2826 [Leptospira interrogans serovar Pomona str. Pomona]|nr:hypothetical protein LEP1GSC014_2826 [Leptospira interrogans serovar Pomona str. Pomona]